MPGITFAKGMVDENEGDSLKVVWVTILLIASALFGQQISTYSGGASNLFLRVNFSASGTAMGNAATGYPMGIDALFFNPAGLALRKGVKFGLNHYQWIEDIRFDNFSVIYQPSYWYAVAGGIAAMWMPAIQGKDAFGNPTDELNVFSGVAYLGVGIQLHPSVYGGVNIKYFYDYLGGYAAQGVAFDVGYFMYTFIDGLSLGVAVQNISKKIKDFQQEAELPLTARVGISYRLFSTGIRINFDAVKSRDTDVFYNAGVEYRLMNLIALRAGNQFKENRNLPTAGVGIQLSDEYRLNYSFTSMEDLGPVHQFGLEVELGRPKSYVKRYRHTIPKNLDFPKATVTIQNNRLVLNWPYEAGKQYDIYIRLVGRTQWKHFKYVINRGTWRFKKPNIPGTYQFRIDVLNERKEVEKSYYAEIHIQNS